MKDPLPARGSPMCCRDRCFEVPSWDISGGAIYGLGSLESLLMVEVRN